MRDVTSMEGIEDDRDEDGFSDEYPRFDPDDADWSWYKSKFSEGVPLRIKAIEVEQDKLQYRDTLSDEVMMVQEGDILVEDGDGDVYSPTRHFFDSVYEAVKTEGTDDE